MEARSQPFPSGGHASRLRHWLDMGWVDPVRAQGDFALQTEKDLRGDRIHAGLAFIWGFLIVGPMSFGEFAIAFPGICWLIRLLVVPRAARWAFAQPTFLMLCLWTLWHLVAWTWSRGGEAAVTQVFVVRFALASLALFTIMIRRGAVIAGMALGFLVGNATQLANWIGVHFDIPAITLHEFADRNGGWWPVTYGAQHLVAALGLHLPVAVMGKGKWRAIGLLGSAVSVAGLIATGARGPWIAALLLTLLVLGVAIVRIRDTRLRVRFALGAGMACILTAAALWVFAGSEINARFAQARDEISRAVEHRDFQKADGSRVGDDSSRVAMLGWALEAIREHPVLGVGTGGYTRYVQETKQADGAVYEDFVRRGHGHCHNAILHEWATTGIVGLAIMLAFAFVAVWSAFAPLTWQSLGTYAAGPAFALVGYFMLAPFEAIQANGTTAKLLFALIAICPAWLPSGSPSPREGAGGRADERSDAR